MADESRDTEEGFELAVAGFKGTAEEIERQWFDQVYKGRGDSMAQLTWRAVLMGSLLGGVLSLTNLYVGLKTGWGFGVAITACILSYAVWTGLYRLGLAKTKMTILENNCMQSTASSAGYSTGGTLVSAFAAYMMLNGHPLVDSADAGLGVLPGGPRRDHGHSHETADDQRRAAPLSQRHRRRGNAAGVHSHGEKGARAARALGIAGVLAAVSQFWTDGLGSSVKQLGALFARALGDSDSTTLSSAKLDRAHCDVRLGSRSSWPPAP